MSIREEYERREEKFMAPFGCLSSRSQGRAVEEKPCSVRTAFQLDRDRIVFSNAFRRLKHKTQVFLAPLGDQYRTRLTHTLEVSQMARVMARALFLNEDLVEAIALAHDLGHTPFGHSGETVLREIYSADFSHNAQSLRVVEKLEKSGKGLNLTAEVRDDIVKQLRFEEEGRQGEVLVELENSEPLAELAAARARLVDSESQYRRSRELFRTQVVSESQLEQLEAQRDADERLRTLDERQVMEAEVAERAVRERAGRDRA